MAKTPPDPTAATASVSQTWGRRSAPSSTSGLDAVAEVGGHDEPDQQDGEEPDAAHASEGQAPAERLAEPGDERRAHHGGDGQPHHDAADRARARPPGGASEAATSDATPK